MNREVLDTLDELYRYFENEYVGRGDHREDARRCWETIDKVREGVAERRWEGVNPAPEKWTRVHVADQLVVCPECFSAVPELLWEAHDFRHEQERIEAQERED